MSWYCYCREPVDVVAKDELLKQVWHDAFVEDGSLTRTISVLRRILGEGRNGGNTSPPYRGAVTGSHAQVTQAGPQPRASIPGKLMLAVLPFENLSEDRTQESSSDGLTEE